MRAIHKSLAVASFVLATLLASGQAQTLDTVVFGNATSENSHSLNAYFTSATDTTKVGWVNTPNPSDPSATGPSDVVSGGLGISARRLLPRTPNADVYGGQMTVTMAVDPVRQNYFSVKLWGSDPNGSNWLILNCNGKEVGVRHGGGGGLYEDSLWYGGSQWFPNRFFYRTAPLPMSMTRGRTSVTLTIRSVGSLFEYAPIFTYVPQYQRLMSSPSEQIYAAYTHTGSLLDVSTEAQGTAPALPTPRTLEDEATALNNVKAGVNSSLAGALQTAATSLSQANVQFLGQCYDAKANYGSTWITYPSGKTDTDLGNLVVAAVDNFVTSYAAGSGVEASDWGGGFAPIGDAIRLTWPLISGAMNTTVAYGGTVGTTTRKAAWAKALRASIDAGRYNRQTIAPQALANGVNIYYANRALLLVDSTKALNESEAIRYLKESVGLQVWLGNDQATGGTDGAGGGPTPTKGIAPYGTSWYMVTTKGTNKDGEGFDGSDYGENGPQIYRLGLLAGDAQLQARALVETRARNQFRYPGADDSGYLIMMGAEPIGVRNNDLPGHYVYLGRGTPDDFLMASQGASAIGSDLMGHFQEAMNDGQAVRFFSTQDPYLPTRWAAIKAQPQTNVKLPMAPGQPDFAWADEENMVVAAKHGEERFYANLFWRQPPFVNGLAKVFNLTPTLARLGDVAVDDVRFRPTGQTVTTGSAVDGFATPADNPQEAFGGLPYSVAYRSVLSAVPATNRDAGRGTGYTLRYGNWLVGINADYSATYTVKLPANFTSATDLISGQAMSGPVTLAAKTSVVFYLPTTTDPSPLPARSLYANAVGSNGRVTLTWANADGAASYNVGRSTTSGSGYATVATGLTGTSYADTAVTNGTTYYYVVTSVGANGASGSSPEASGKPVAPQTAALPAPWTDVDEGVSTGGTAALASGTFTVKAGGGTFGGTTEGFHLVYQPMTGDGVLTAKISSQTSGSTTASRAGLVLRSNLAQNATMGAMLLQKISSTKYAANFQYCGGDGGSIVTAGGPGNLSEPYWVRLVRSGLTITGYVSADGTTWTQVGSYSYGALPYTLYAGLLVNYGATTPILTTTATFTNVNFPLAATAAPSVPTGLTATSASTTSAALKWTEASGAVSYNVKRGTSASGPFTTVASGVVGTTYTDYGLVNGNTYYYVVSAVNSYGESANSSSVTATVLSPPAALGGLKVTASGTQAVLSWTASPGATSYIVSRSTSYAGTYTVIAGSVTGTTYTDTGLSATTLYYYKVTPVGGGGSGMGGVITAIPTSLPGPWQTQDIGSNVPGGAYASGGVFNLFGNGYTYASNPDSCRYVYQTLTGDGAITIRVTGQSNANYDTTGIMLRDSFDPASRSVYLSLNSNSSGSSINWEYRSTNGGGIATSFGGISTSAPCWLRAMRLGNTYALFTSADGHAWTQFAAPAFPMNSTICVGMATTSGDGTAINTATIDNVAVTASVVNGGTATASAQVNPTGNGAAQAAFDATISTKWLTVASTGYLQYQFASGVSQVVKQYQLISAEDVPQRDPASWQFQGSNDGTTWTALDAQTGQVFANRNQANVYNVSNTTAYAYYRLNITANNGGASSAVQLSELNLYAANPGTALVPPAMPLGLSAAWSTGQIALNWQATFMAASYNVKRGTATGGPYTTVASGLTNPGYTDTAVTNGTPYYYVVSAVNGGGESPNSAENGATTYAVPPAPTGVAASTGNAQVGVNWTAVPGVSGYNVKRATVSGGPYTTVAGTMNVSYADTAVTLGTAYYYVVTAVDLAGESPNSTQASATATLLPPTGLAATPGNAKVALNWNAQPNATGYSVKRATVSGGPHTAVGNPSGNSFTDTGLTNNTTYYYVVSTVVSGQQSANSNEVNTTPPNGTSQGNYNSWQSSYFTPAQMNDPNISGPNGDANGDGVKNIVAYAFNVGPWDNIAGVLPTAQVANVHLTLSFIRRTDATDVTYTVEVSGDLINWASGPDYTTNLSAQPNGNNTEAVVFGDNAPVSSGARFMRLKIGY